MEPNAPDTFRLPREITRPIWRATVSVFVFLAVAVAWASLAEIATTIKVSGLMRSKVPSFAVQHPDGGKVAEVFVKPFQEVMEGDPILRLDTEDIELRLAAIVRRLGMLQIQNAGLRKRLQLPADDGGVGVAALGAAVLADFQDAFEREAANESTRMASYGLTETAARDSLAAAFQERDALAEVIEILSSKLETEEALASSGSVAKRAVDETRQQLFLSRSEHAAMDRVVAGLISDIRQARSSADVYFTQQRLKDSEKLNLNTRETTDLLAERDLLVAAASRAVVYAPTNGVITSLSASTQNTVLRPGTTIAVVSQPLNEPVIQLRVPPTFVDQVREGHEGYVQLDSLSSREMPRLSITVTGVSSEAELDESGQPMFYAAEAEMSQEDLELAKSVLGDRFQMQLDMPASAFLSGEPTTFMAFLLGPLKSITQGAFQSS